VDLAHGSVSLAHACLHSSAHCHCFGHTQSTRNTPAAMARRRLFLAVLATCWFIASPPASVLQVDRLPAPTRTTTSPTSARGSADRSPHWLRSTRRARPSRTQCPRVRGDRSTHLRRGLPPLGDSSRRDVPRVHPRFPPHLRRRHGALLTAPHWLRSTLRARPFPDPVPALPWGSEHAPPPRIPTEGLLAARCPEVPPALPAASPTSVWYPSDRGVFSASSAITAAAIPGRAASSPATLASCFSERVALSPHSTPSKTSSVPAPPECEFALPSPRLAAPATSTCPRDSSECVGPSPHRAASAAPSAPGHRSQRSSLPAAETASAPPTSTTTPPPPLRASSTSTSATPARHRWSAGSAGTRRATI
jgi:hypothetical protein